MARESPSSATGAYSFRLLDAAAAPTLTLGDSPSGTLLPGTSATIYRIAGTAGQQIRLTPSGANSGGAWYLFNPTNGQITGNSLGGALTATFASTGDYLLVLIGSGENPVPYSFTYGLQ